MKFTEKIGDIEMTYEGTPKEIMELRNRINPTVLTIKDDKPLKEFNFNPYIEKLTVQSLYQPKEIISSLQSVDIVPNIIGMR